MVSEGRCGSVLIDLTWELRVELDSWISMILNFVQGGVCSLS